MSKHLRRSQTTSGPVSSDADVDTAANANVNLFDVDVDFAQVQKRRERAKAAKDATREPDERPILEQMDHDLGDATTPTNVDVPPTVAPTTSKRRDRTRPKIVTRAKTTGSEIPDSSKKKSFFGFKSTVQEEILLDQDRDMEPIMVGTKCLAIWPYDDYHLVQKMYYEKLEHRMDDDAQPRTPSSSFLSANSKNGLSSPTMPDSSIPIFSRPPDPPDIPSAVKALSLTEFERVAEERSIAIVSTWLFDAGLIDELLVNGGMTGSSWKDTASVDGSVQTSEGIEVGAMGFPIEGSTKMDKEIAKLRNATKRQLALINARLNDGVAATGSEVQELVNAVICTKDDVGRLRELSTYVSNTDSVEHANRFMLAKYPKLKQAINARRNLARCFRELDFFSQIPSSCERLREELHSGEWTAHEWSSLRSVCREHVELEIFLVEAEAGMKKRLEDGGEENASTRSSRHRKQPDKFGRQVFAQSGLQQHKDEVVDRFLGEHVENVWELGDEIRIRIMSGIAASFDLAMNNPAGMVALVEAIEVYESASSEYKQVHGEEAGSSQTLRFTDMRAAALGELYKDFEARGLDVFRELTMQAADLAEEKEASNKQFSAVLRSANELTSEIGLVKEQMAPCFPPNWCIETLWTTCVAHVCSNNILQQIGGPEGHKLPDLTVTQLLDLVAWVETFREIIEETFPNMEGITSSRTYFDKAPKLLGDDSKTVDIELARDSLAWVNNTLWDVHDLAKDEFLFRTKEQTEEWLNNVYEAQHEKSQTAEGFLVTSLCEDVYSVAGVQLRTIRERLTRRSEALVQAVGVIFKNLYEKQIECRDRFCIDLETCCAASNDFIRMSEKCEELVEEIKEECNLTKEGTATLEEQTAALLGLYSGDAVYAAQKTHLYCFQPIEEEVADELFGEEWLDVLTNNELALTIVRTLDDFMEDLETFLDEVMVQRTIEAQISASVNFYLKCLLTRSKYHGGRGSMFSNTEKAIHRMRGDVTTMRDYFDGLSESTPTLKRVIEREFGLLDTIVELLTVASGQSKSEVNDFILMLQKRVRNMAITKYVVGDLYHLVNPSKEKEIYDLVDSMESDMNAVAPTDEKAIAAARDRMSVPGLRVDQTMAEHCASSQRKRPLQKGPLERAEAALRMWRGKD
jgi:hypothetical protein